MAKSYVFHENTTYRCIPNKYQFNNPSFIILEKLGHFKNKRK